MDHPRDSGFGAGLLVGACVGAGLALWLAPRLVEQYRQAGLRVSEAVDEIGRKGRGLRDEAAKAVAYGVDVAERVATAAKS
jgi:gas vesicle protein